MSNTKSMRPLMTLAVVIGLLAAAGPASASGIDQPPSQVTMLDYEGSPVVTYSFTPPIGTDKGSVR